MLSAQDPTQLGGCHWKLSLPRGQGLSSRGRAYSATWGSSSGPTPSPVPGPPALQPFCLVHTPLPIGPHPESSCQSSGIFLGTHPLVPAHLLVTTAPKPTCPPLLSPLLSSEILLLPAPTSAHMVGSASKGDFRSIAGNSAASEKSRARQYSTELLLLLGPVSLPASSEQMGLWQFGGD